MTVLNQQTSEVYRVDVMAKKMFFWHLKPGIYVLIGWDTEFYSDNFRQTQSYRIVAEFSVPAEEKAVYIGTVYAGFGSSSFVEDEYESAQRVFEENFSGNGEKLFKRLMVPEARR